MMALHLIPCDLRPARRFIKLLTLVGWEKIQSDTVSEDLYYYDRFQYYWHTEDIVPETGKRWH